MIKMHILRTRSATLNSSSERVDVESLPTLPADEQEGGATTADKLSAPKQLLSTSGGMIDDNEPKDVTLTLWDFAGKSLIIFSEFDCLHSHSFTFFHSLIPYLAFTGQEIYYTTHEFFLSERSLYLVIFDLSKGLNASYLEHWYFVISAWRNVGWSN